MALALREYNIDASLLTDTNPIYNIKVSSDKNWIAVTTGFSKCTIYKRNAVTKQYDTAVQLNQTGVAMSCEFSSSSTFLYVDNKVGNVNQILRFQLTSGVWTLANTIAFPVTNANGDPVLAFSLQNGSAVLIAVGFSGGFFIYNQSTSTVLLNSTGEVTADAAWANIASEVTAGKINNGLIPWSYSGNVYTARSITGGAGNGDRAAWNVQPGASPDYAFAVDFQGGAKGLYLYKISQTNPFPLIKTKPTIAGIVDRLAKAVTWLYYNSRQYLVYGSSDTTAGLQDKFNLLLDTNIVANMGTLTDFPVTLSFTWSPMLYLHSSYRQNMLVVAFDMTSLPSDGSGKRMRVLELSEAIPEIRGDLKSPAFGVTATGKLPQNARANLLYGKAFWAGEIESRAPKVESGNFGFSAYFAKVYGFPHIDTINSGAGGEVNIQTLNAHVPVYASGVQSFADPGMFSYAEYVLPAFTVDYRVSRYSNVNGNVVYPQFQVYGAGGTLTTDTALLYSKFITDYELKGNVDVYVEAQFPFFVTNYRFRLINHLEGDWLAPKFQMNADVYDNYVQADFLYQKFKSSHRLSAFTARGTLGFSKFQTDIFASLPIDADIALTYPKAKTDITLKAPVAIAPGVGADTGTGWVYRAQTVRFNSIIGIRDLANGAWAASKFKLNAQLKPANTLDVTIKFGKVFISSTAYPLPRVQSTEYVFPAYGVKATAESYYNLTARMTVGPIEFPSEVELTYTKKSLFIFEDAI